MSKGRSREVEEKGAVEKPRQEVFGGLGQVGSGETKSKSGRAC